MEAPPDVAPRRFTCAGKHTQTRHIPLPGNLPRHTTCCRLWTPCGCSSPAGSPERLSRRQHPSHPDSATPPLAPVKTVWGTLTGLLLGGSGGETRSWSVTPAAERNADWCGLDALPNGFVRLAVLVSPLPRACSLLLCKFTATSKHCRGGAP